MYRALMSTIVATGLVFLGGSGCTPMPADAAPSPPVAPTRTLSSQQDFLDWVLADTCYTPSAAALALPPAPAARFGTVRAPLVTQQGEILIMEGTEQTVSTMDGGFGIVMTGPVQNPPAITKAFLAERPDEFDAIAVFTTFPDRGSQDSVAWHLNVRQDVFGIGSQVTDSGVFWGSDEGGQLHGFINMQYVGKYGSGLEQPNHWIHQVMAHEFAHRWLVHAEYVDASGAASDALLGRQKAHWANGVQADASVMDGYQWQDLGEFFLMKASNQGYSMLDRYLMGLAAPEEVPDFFVIHDMILNGKAIDPAAQLPYGAHVQGTREDVTMDMIRAAMGDRKPSYETSQKDFRIAIVLLTAPGESVEKAAQLAEGLEGFRHTFEQRVNEFSGGRVHVCTQLSAPCNAPGVSLAGFEITEHEGNGDGRIDPGDTVAISLRIQSTGVGTAPAVTVELEEPNLPELAIITPEVTVGDIPEGETAEASAPLLIKIPPFIGCGAEAVIPIRLKTQERSFPAQIRFRIGVDTVVQDELEVPDGWTLNPYQTDDAEDGVWEIGQPQGVDALYAGIDLVAQPSQDHSPTGVSALVTGKDGGSIGERDVDGGVTTALSPVYDLAEARDPLLTWYSWHAAYDFNGPDGITPVDNDALITEASGDGGLTWVVIDVDTSNEQVWLKKELRISEVLGPVSSLQLRFSVTDEDWQSMLEAAVDDIRIWDESTVCRPAPLRPNPTETRGSDATSTETASAQTGGTGESSTPSDPPAATPAPDSGGCLASPHPNGGSLPAISLVLVLLALLRPLRRAPVHARNPASQQGDAVGVIPDTAKGRHSARPGHGQSPNQS